MSHKNEPKIYTTTGRGPSNAEKLRIISKTARNTMWHLKYVSQVRKNAIYLCLIPERTAKIILKSRKNFPRLPQKGSRTPTEGQLRLIFRPPNLAPSWEIWHSPIPRPFSSRQQTNERPLDHWDQFNQGLALGFLCSGARYEGVQKALLKHGDIHPNPGPPFSDYQFRPELIRPLVEELGCPFPYLDAFSSQQNAVLPRYWTAEGDSFSKSWRCALLPLWANPPFHMLQKVFEKIYLGGAYLILV